MKNTTVLYHADADGFGAAFAIWFHYNKYYTTFPTFIPVQYSQPVPELPENTEALYIVDFSYSREICEALAAKYEVEIIDHHKTAQKELEGLPYATFDMSRSGCALTWFEFNGEALPAILAYAEDRDLWKFSLWDSEAINLYIASMPFDFEEWYEASQDSEFIRKARDIGGRIKSFRDNQIKAVLTNARTMVLAGHEVPVANCSANVSETGHDLLKAYPSAPFSVTYCDRKDVRSWSLRSRGGFDVSEVAKMFGGGGHPGAAGFSTEIGWPSVPPEEFLKTFEELVR